MLSLAIIAKDEVQTIERTIMSVRDCVDEVVVGLDTESSDGTAEIVRRLADKVIDIHLSQELALKGPLKGKGDWGFSHARNQVLLACTADSWRLGLDGHEMVLNTDRLMESLEAARGGGFDSVEVTVAFEPNEHGISQTDFRSVRVIGPEVLYRNSIHTYPAAQRTYPAHEVIVEHRKQDQAPTAKRARDVQRAEANIEGLRNKVRVDANDTRSWFYLGTTYKENSRFHEAIPAFEQCLNFSIWNEERWHCRVDIGLCYLHLGDERTAREHFVMALEEHPAMAEAYYHLGNLAYKQKLYHEAQVWLEKCVELDPPNCKLFVNPKVYMIHRHDLLAMVYNHLGQFGKAIEQGELALKAAPNPRIENNVHIWHEHIEKHGGEYYDEMWGKSAQASALEQQRMAIMARMLGKVSRVLDVGSGPGAMIDHLPEDVEYFGLDISLVARDAVAEKGGRPLAELAELNGETFDGCILGEVLEHLTDDVGMLLELRQRLSPAGAVVVASIPRYGAMRDPAHTRDYTAAEFRELMATVGEVEECTTVGPWVICRAVR